MSETNTLPSEWTMRYDDEHVFPFVDDENGNITGYGHQDRAAFAAAINEYDALCSGFEVLEGDTWTAADVVHRWVAVDADGERLRPCGPGTPDAIPVTALWGQR